MEYYVIKRPPGSGKEIKMRVVVKDSRAARAFRTAVISYRRYHVRKVGTESRRLVTLGASHAIA